MKMRFVILAIGLFLFLVGCKNTEAIPPTAISQPEVGKTAVPPPITVTYFTPSQQEGPYYTVNKPDDRDNDLTVLVGADGAPTGEVIEFGGKLYDAAGIPVAGAVIEIWQTDASGVYLHPNDPGTEQRDPNFQFYGEAITAEDGRYNFRTILPGEYEPRPRHIHVKVKLDGEELITTQFYFSGGPTGTATNIEPTLLINLAPGQDVKGSQIWAGQRDIVLNVKTP